MPQSIVSSVNVVRNNEQPRRLPDDRRRLARFVTLEGIEGAGKSSCVEDVRNWLTQRRIDHILTREPGGTELGERVREWLLSHHEGGVSPNAELLLIFAARAEHLARVIQPALDAGSWVVCDRFTDATYAYQGAGRGIPRQHVHYLERMIQSGLNPDMTLLLDLPVSVGLQRAVGRGSQRDRFESEQTPFFERVRQAYLELARQEPERFRQIDAAQPREEVSRQIVHALDELSARDPHFN